MNSVYTKIIAAWSAIFIIGFVIGKAKSPDFSEKSYVEDYIEKQTEVAAFFNDDKTVSTGTLFNAGRYLYIYNRGTGKVNKIKNLNHNAGTHTKKLKLEDYKEIMGASSIPISMELKDIKTVFTNGDKTSVWALIVGSVLAGGLGYELGYEKDGFDPDSNVSKEVLMDSSFWESTMVKDKLVQN